MTVLVVVLCSILGLAVGSFLNVVVWRVPRGESIISPPSACPGCGRAIRARDNVPVLSWLILRGRCRDCSMSISARYPLVELLTAVVFGIMAWTFSESWALPAYLVFGAIAVALAFIDLDTHTLPNAIVLPAYPVIGGLLVVGSALEGDWWALVRAGIAGVVLWTFYFVLAIAWPGGMGFGDVKLAGVVGLVLGWCGWGSVVVGGFGAFLLGGVAAGVLMASGRVGRKDGVPFGPWLLLGALIGIVAGETLWSSYLAIAL